MRALFLHPYLLRIAAVAALIFMAGCADEPQPTPSELIGIWRTAAPRHADRTLEVRADAVLFGRGKYSSPVRHSITSAIPGKSNGKSDIRSWVVMYRESDGSISEVELLYQDKPLPTLKFANRDEVWMKKVERKPNAKPI